MLPSLEYASAAFLFISAAFWLASTLVEVPILHGVIGEIGEPLQKLSQALIWQSTLNKVGAVTAAVGVAFQATAILLRGS